MQRIGGLIVQTEYEGMTWIATQSNRCPSNLCCGSRLIYVTAAGAGLGRTRKYFEVSLRLSASQSLQILNLPKWDVNFVAKVDEQDNVELSASLANSYIALLKAWEGDKQLSRGQ